MIRFDDVHYHKLNQPDIENRLSILLDVDFEQVLAGTMQRASNGDRGTARSPVVEGDGQVQG